MKKTFKLVDLDCAHCAAKMEKGIKKLPGVINAEVNFLTQKMIIEAEDDKFDVIYEEAVKLIHKLEPEVVVKKA